MKCRCCSIPLADGRCTTGTSCAGCLGPQGDDLDAERCASCGRRRELYELTLPDGAGTFRMCIGCAGTQIRETGAENIRCVP